MSSSDSQQLIVATFFGETKEVLATIYNAHLPGKIEKVLWVERPEDNYALISPQLRNKKVAAVTRDHWIAT
jgi:hypothetical protein